jgi:hypothetical protein
MAVRRAKFACIIGYKGNNLQAWSPIALGGTITEAGGFRTHTFTTVGSDTFRVVSGLSSVEYLVVAGGGGGGRSNSDITYQYTGGGGAGGMRTASISTTSGTFSTTVGSGGVIRSDGTNSSFLSVVSIGGGGGGQGSASGDGPTQGRPGGSGGGGANT